MTTATVGQAGAEVLYRVIPQQRVSQTGAEYLHRVIPGIIASQAGIEYLHRVTPSFGITQSGVEFLHKLVPCSTKWAQIWTITRTDGEVYRFTSKDTDLDFGGHTYAACNSMTPSASENAAEAGSVGNMELAGLLASGAISMADLHAGLFDGAQVEAWLVPWQGTETPKALLTGTFGKVDFGENGFKVELMGDGGRLQQTPLVRTLQPNCRWQFGDAFCGKELAPLTVTGTVDSGVGQRGFTDAARAEAAGYFSRGRVTFTSGANAGISAEIKSHETGGVFTLWPRLANPIVVGDQYSMVPGCTNMLEAANGTNGCTAWDNVVNNGGFEWVPGADAVKKTPEQKKA